MQKKSMNNELSCRADGGAGADVGAGGDVGLLARCKEKMQRNLVK